MAEVHEDKRRPQPTISLEARNERRALCVSQNVPKVFLKKLVEPIKPSGRDVTLFAFADKARQSAQRLEVLPGV
jgi:hypothetical protein